MTGLDGASSKIDVADVVIRRGVADGDAGEIMTVELGTTFSCVLDADPGSKEAEVGQAGFLAPEGFVGGTANGQASCASDGCGGRLHG